ncbi:hypothetical protein DMP06_11140 [Slackia equolifaciens]|uniref:Uncharacterized protein n=1 Tax=Slackia equolifaciens TaxID=498718 RepID=A0A3N0AR84_9ACTN|nr:hypothetical protein DMP06_11140 [Slackia equolifaciens]
MIGARGMHRFCLNKQASEGGEPCACSVNYKDGVLRTYDDAVEVLCSRMQIGVKPVSEIALAQWAIVARRQAWVSGRHRSAAGMGQRLAKMDICRH